MIMYIWKEKKHQNKKIKVGGLQAWPETVSWWDLIIMLQYEIFSVITLQIYCNVFLCRHAHSFYQAANLPLTSRAECLLLLLSHNAAPSSKLPLMVATDGVTEVLVGLQFLHSNVFCTKRLRPSGEVTELCQLRGSSNVQWGIVQTIIWCIVPLFSKILLKQSKMSQAITLCSVAVYSSTSSCYNG
jgi:hypothetical protein